jgi:hypothetical protein
MLSSRAFLLIAVVLCLDTTAGNGDDKVSVVRLREAEIARDAWEQQCLQLSVRVVRLEAALGELRSDYAAADVAAKECRQELEFLRLSAANLLVNRDNLTAALALDEMKRLQASWEEIYRESREFQSFLNSVLEVLDPAGESPVSEVLQSKLGHLIRRLEAADTLLAMPEGVSGDLAACRVFAMETDKQLVALNVGFNHGALPGMVGRIEGGGGLGYDFQIVEVRPTISAAVVTTGNMATIAVGAAARMTAKPTKEK